MAFNPSDASAPAHYPASATALVLLDFHSLFVSKAGGPDAQAALATAVSMRTWAHSRGIRVIHCLIDVNATPFPTCKASDRLAATIAAAKASGGDAEPDVLLQGANGDVTFTRRPGHVSALKSPGLREYLEKHGIRSLVLTGLSTSGCVMRTSVTACDEEFVVTTISDGCADPVDGVHDLMIERILNNRGWVASATEFQHGYDERERES